MKVKGDGVRKGAECTTTSVSMEWVEKHFKHVVLGDAQKIAYQVREELQFKDKTVPASKRHGYVKVESEGITCSILDKRVINRLKYMASKTIKIGPLYTLDKKGKRVPVKQRDTKTLPARWLGYCNETKESIALEDLWVTQNFDENFLVQVMSCTRSTHAFIQIPPGDCRTHQSVGPMNGPKIHYEQKDGEQTCMVYSIASALHYFGYKNIGSCVFNGRKRFIHQNNAFNVFIEVLRGTHAVLNQVRVAKDQFPSFLGAAFTGIYLARLLGSDGKEDHCVVISQKWIFDSNFPNALPRTQESLDLCCSSDEHTSTFRKFPQIVHFPKVKATT